MNPECPRCGTYTDRLYDDNGGVRYACDKCGGVVAYRPPPADRTPVSDGTEESEYTARLGPHACHRCDE